MVLNGGGRKRLQRSWDFGGERHWDLVLWLLMAVDGVGLRLGLIRG